MTGMALACIAAKIQEHPLEVAILLLSILIFSTLGATLGPYRTSITIMGLLLLYILLQGASTPVRLIPLAAAAAAHIAAVLAYDPEIIVLDEPTAGQDYIQKEHISGTMNLLRTMQKTVVIVTHDMEFVVQYVDRIVLMSRGRIVASASPHEVLLNPSLLASAGLMPPQLARLALQLSRAGIYTPRRLPETGEIVDAVLKRWHR